MNQRPATQADVPRVVETIAGAFDADPAWSWAFDDPELRRAVLPTVWRLLTVGALRYSSVWMTSGAESVSVWLPPGGTELAPEQESELEAVIDALPASTRDRARTLWSMFDDHHPTSRPHYFLSLFATHPDHRGHGYGMRLLASDLERIDAEGGAAYLESTNPGNNARYASVGFHVVGSFRLPNGPTVTTMWRDARSTRD